MGVESFVSYIASFAINTASASKVGPKKGENKKRKDLLAIESQVLLVK